MDVLIEGGCPDSGTAILYRSWSMLILAAVREFWTVPLLDLSTVSVSRLMAVGICASSAAVVGIGQTLARYLVST